MLKEIWSYLNSLEFGIPDPHAKDTFLIVPPFKIFLLNLAYFLFVFKIGPAFMRNREPFKLKKILLVYNLLQILLNLWTPVCGFITLALHGVYNFGCIRPLPWNHPDKAYEVSSFYVYFLLKYIDYLDTIFFVLRKSTRQITFLHVYHHMLMANASYIYIRYLGFGGHIGSMGIANSTVHIFMYFYYFMSALRPKMMSSLWWKQYITILQLIQFMFVFLHNLYPLIFRSDCDRPVMLFFVMLQAIIMFFLFAKFYKKTYMQGKINKKNQKQQQQQQQKIEDCTKTKRQ